MVPSGPLEWSVISLSTLWTGLFWPCSLVLTRLGAHPWVLAQSAASVLDAPFTAPFPPPPPVLSRTSGPALAGKMMSTVHMGGRAVEASWKQLC